ncbi:MAG: hypothetical protein KUG68_08005 [Flavobacteriaceae bacterium]|nr:hypothetical protein [Flavobacteriaceae bacterium]
MSGLKKYIPLFTLNIFHKYLLNDGITDFDDTPQLKEEQLRKYNLSDFIHIIPSERTIQDLKGRKLLFKPNNSGITIYVMAEETAPNSGIYTPKRTLDQDFSLDLLLYIKDPLFENYSIVSAVNETPFYFTNKKPATEIAPYNYIDTTGTTLIENYTISETTYGEISKRLAPKEMLQLFGIISLEMAGDDTFPIDGFARNIIELNGDLVASTPEFKIQFENRSTIWNYRNTEDDTILNTSDPQELPLVKNGIVVYSFDGIERPVASPNRLIFEKDINGNIIKTFSEIYI